MKHADIYEQLTSKERAVLCVECLAYGETREPRHIANSVPYDVDFLQYGQALTTLGLYYGQQYWRVRWAILAADNPKPLITQLASLHEALRAVCIKQGVELGAIQQIANCRGEPIIGTADLKLTEQYTKTFMGLILCNSY